MVRGETHKPPYPQPKNPIDREDPLAYLPDNEAEAVAEATAIRWALDKLPSLVACLEDHDVEARVGTKLTFVQLQFAVKWANGKTREQLAAELRKLADAVEKA